MQSRVKFPDTLLPAVVGDDLEIDEVATVIFGWSLRALRISFLVWRVRDRSEKTLQKLWFQVPACYHRKLVYTDFYEAYATFFAPWQHRPSGKGSVIEGLDNKWRNRVAGLVRKTVCVQSLADLNNRLWVVLEAHNRLCLKQLERLTAATH